MSQSPSSANDAFNDSLNFVKKLWGSMSLPGMTVPEMPAMGMPVSPMSLGELDKRIQELKTVETWLALNTTMLRNSIQALEIQRATIATLHSLSSTMAQTMQNANASGAENPFATGAALTEETNEGKNAGAFSNAPLNVPSDVSPLVTQSAAWWQGVQEQFKQALGAALANSVANDNAGKPATEEVTKTASDTVSATAEVKTKPAAKVASKAASKPVS